MSLGWSNTITEPAVKLNKNIKKEKRKRQKFQKSKTKWKWKLTTTSIILYYITGFVKLKLVGIKQMNDLQINTKLGCFKSHESQ